MVSRMVILLQVVKPQVRHRYDPVLYRDCYVSFGLQDLLLTGHTLDHARLVLNIWELHLRIVHLRALRHVWTSLVSLGCPCLLHF